MDIRVREQLLETLTKIDRPGTFCTSGRMPAMLPGLEVADLGSIGLPLEKRQAAALKKLARQAPYGKGTRTLVDTGVRRVWEIDADRVLLANPEWSNVLKQVVAAAQSELGLKEQKLEAHLYKLLLYEPGSFFLSHRDGEKLDRMVATLVIALPSAHEGGELIVRHEGREETVDFGPESRFQTQFAAFYADCEHEIRPVTSGFRLALVYNLTLTKSKPAISAPTTGEHIAAVVRILQQWKDEIDKSKMPVDSDQDQPATKLAVVLDHEYTQAGLTYDALKGIDRAKADVLFAAARQTGCDASLALVTKWVSGSAEPSDDYGYGRSRRRGRYGYDDGDEEERDEGEHHMGEVFDESLTAEHFSDAAGNRLAYERIPLVDDEIVSGTPLSEGMPDKEDFEGYTGNAGMTLERWYHRAAIILWPAEFRFDVLCEAGVEAAVGGLEQMVRRWKQAGKSEQEALHPLCLDFARRIIARWPERNFASGFFANYGGEEDEDCFDDEDFDDENFDDVSEDQGDFEEDRSLRKNPASSNGSRQSLLSLLEELGDVSLINAWLRGVFAKDVSVDPGKSLGDLCQQHGWSMFQDELRELFENTSNETLERHARLLADWSQRQDLNADGRANCSQLACQIMSAVENWNPQQAKRDWRAKTVKRSELLPPLVQSFLALEQAELFERLVKYILDRPKEFDLTTVQVPALLRLKTWLKRNVEVSSSPLHVWLSAALAELESRASRPPQEPADWRRESATGCNCADCRELSRFLKDPHTKMLRIPLAQDRRQHLHQVIDGERLDTTHVTERRGRPYVLVCTKTKASYERALKAHQVDLDHLDQIRKLLAWSVALPANPNRQNDNPPKTRKPKSKKSK